VRTGRAKAAVFSWGYERKVAFIFAHMNFIGGSITERSGDLNRINRAIHQVGLGEHTGHRNLWSGRA
jgi:hypothetical protein